jgi:hypothetical protein
MSRSDALALQRIPRAKTIQAFAEIPSIFLVRLVVGPPPPSMPSTPDAQLTTDRTQTLEVQPRQVTHASWHHLAAFPRVDSGALRIVGVACILL